MAGLLFAGVVTSCDKDNYAELDGNGSESMDIPEGYMKISFPVGTDMQTRAAVSGVTAYDIVSLHYLRYKKNESGEFILEQVGRPLDKQWKESQVWPLSYSDVIKKDETYRFVFLGNMDSDLWDGDNVVENISVNDNFTEARIHAPQSGFTADRMFYFFDSGEITATERNETVTTLLKRIVTRHDITPTSIPEDVSVTGNTYSDRYYNSLLLPGQPVGDKVFYTAESYMGEQLQKQLFRDIIFPLLYILDIKETLSGSTELEQQFKSMDKDTYLTEAYGEVWSGQTEVMKTSLNNYANQLGRGYVTGENRTKLLQFLDNLYKGEYASEMLAKIAELDYQKADVQEGAIAGISGTNCFTNAKESVSQSLTRCGQFPTWKNYTEMNIQLQGNFPTTLDFNLLSQENTTDPIRKIALTEGTEFKDNQLSIVCLAEKTSEQNFGFSSLTDTNGNPVSHPTFGEAGKALAANTFWEYYMDIQSINFSDDDTVGEGENKQEIYYSYKGLIESITDSDIPLTTDYLLSNSGGPVFDALVFAFHNTEGTTNLERALGVIYYNTANSPQYGFDFNIPDFKNVTVTKVWRSERKNEK